MSKKQTATAVAVPDQVYLQVTLNQDRVSNICSFVEGNASAGEKLSGVAQGLLEHLADGGMMVSPLEVQRLQEAAGGEIDSASQLVPLIEAGSGLQDGGLCVTWRVDPVYIPQFEDIARFRGCDVLEVVQDGMNTAMENGWIYEAAVGPKHVLMSPEDHAELVELLGGDFDHGTKLAALIRNAIGTEAPFAVGT